jgi:hypothetical protein
MGTRIPMAGYTPTYMYSHTLKNLVFWGKIKSAFSPVFSRKTESFRSTGGFCWPIGVTAALLGRSLPSDGHKLVKTPGNLGPKVPQIVHFFGRMDFQKIVYPSVRSSRIHVLCMLKQALTVEDFSLCTLFDYSV